MDQGLIPARYAKALYNTATLRSVAPDVYATMKTLLANYAAQPALARTIDNPYVSTADKMSILDTAAQIQANDSTTQQTLNDFFTLLIQNNRIQLLRNIAAAYTKYYRQQHNIVPVTITSAVPLSNDELKRITDSIIPSLAPGASPEISTMVDPKIIGGLIINVDSKRLDASISNQINQLRNQLISH